MRKYALLLLLLLFPIVVEAQYSLWSPDMSVQVNFTTRWNRNPDKKSRRPAGMKMTVRVDGVPVLRDKEIGLCVFSAGRRFSFGKSSVTITQKSRYPQNLGMEDDTCLDELGDRYNRLVLKSSTGIVLEVLAFNHGVAYRFSVTGQTDEYKILDVCNVFPGEKPNAILGTFAGDMVLPWRTMLLDCEEDEVKAVAPETSVWKDLYPSNKIVSWKDALSSASVGFTVNWFSGKEWGLLSESSSFCADFIYKYLYAGLSFTPCNELLYIHYEHDFPPFDRVAGSVHSWDVSGRLGFSLPVQLGFNVWSFSPYATATYLALRQHGEVHPSFQPLSNKHHYLVGLGLKVQCMMHGRISLGMGYEYQLFTGSNEPKGRNALSFTLGYGF